MKLPPALSSFLEGDSPKRLFQGAIIGVLATLIVGFGWSDWDMGGTVEKKVTDATNSATVMALAPICANKFESAAQADQALVAGLKAVESWRRDDHLIDTGWATFPGGAEPSARVARACAELLDANLKLN